MKMHISSIFNFFLNLKLKQKLLLSYVLLILVPLVAFYQLFDRKISDIIMANTNYSAERGFDQTFDFLSNKINHINRVADVIYNEKSISEILNKEADIYPVSDQLEDMQFLSQYLKSFEDKEDIDKVRLYVPSGLVYSYENVNLFNFDEINTTEWYRRMYGKTFTLAYLPSHMLRNEDNGSEVLSVARYIINTNNYKEKLGILRLDFDKNDIEQVINNANTIEGGLTYLENSFGEIVAASDDILVNQYRIPSEIIDAINNNVNFEHTLLNNEKVMFRTKFIPKTDWKMITVIPENIITKKINSTMNQLLVIMLVISLIAYALAYSIAHFMVKRISILKTQMNKIHKGTLEPLVNTGSNDEIGELILDYNFMISKIKLLMEEQYQSGQRLKAAELKALQAQINPHFLYNILELINRLSKKNKMSEIEEVIHSLTRFYKLNLSKGDDFISLRDELDHVSAYVSIQNMRFKNKISFEVNVAPEFLDMLVPKLILQPIVENSIIHGIIEKDEGTGVIKIFSSVEGDNLILSIQDNGKGVPNDILAKINYGQISDSKGSYGIKNVVERIKLIYGDAYGLEYLSKYNEGTTVRIKLPIYKRIRKRI
jgi:two-component system sensor histidine kinase YesM